MGPVSDLWWVFWLSHHGNQGHQQWKYFIKVEWGRNQYCRIYFSLYNCKLLSENFHHCFGTSVRPWGVQCYSHYGKQAHHQQKYFIKQEWDTNSYYCIFVSLYNRKIIVRKRTAPPWDQCPTYGGCPGSLTMVSWVITRGNISSKLEWHIYFIQSCVKWEMWEGSHLMKNMLEFFFFWKLAYRLLGQF